MEQLHAAISSWFDYSHADHDAPIKPYAMSPIGRSSTENEEHAVGFELSVLTDRALERLRSATEAGREIRLGAQRGRVARAVGLMSESWESLSTPSGAHAWQLEFITPATFRQGNRSSPWPAPSSVLHGLQQSWTRCSGLTPRELNYQQLRTIWVSDIAGNSEPMNLSGLRVSGFVGRIRYQCDRADVADLIDPLLRMAAYSGVGSAKAKGLGVTRLPKTWQASGARKKAS
jgi:CRISPR-associated endoribonuclease Cas6